MLLNEGPLGKVRVCETDNLLILLEKELESEGASNILAAIVVKA